MKPPSFVYTRPQSLQPALDLLHQHGYDAKLLAGGQSLLPLMNFRLAAPAMLIDINDIPDMDGILDDPNLGLRIGAMTRQRRIERDPLVARSSPLLYETVPNIAHPQIRNRGTIGGSLVHADPAGEMPAIAIALEAQMRIRNISGERWVPAKDFFVGLMTTCLEPEEMLIEVAYPKVPPGSGSAFLEIARRQGDYAMVGVAAVVRLAGDRSIREAKLVFMSVGETPLEANRAAALLVGQRPQAETFEAAAHVAAEEEIDPSTDIHASEEYKRHLAKVLTHRVLQSACRRAAGDGGDHG